MYKISSVTHHTIHWQWWQQQSTKHWVATLLSHSWSCKEILLLCNEYYCSVSGPATGTTTSSAGGTTASDNALPTTSKGIVILQGSHTLGKPKKPPKGPQRHSAGNIDYDNHDTSRDSGEDVPHCGSSFRSRSKTVSDGTGRCTFEEMYHDHVVGHHLLHLTFHSPSA